MNTCMLPSWKKWENDKQQILLELRQQWKGFFFFLFLINMCHFFSSSHKSILGYFRGEQTQPTTAWVVIVWLCCLQDEDSSHVNLNVPEKQTTEQCKKQPSSCSGSQSCWAPHSPTIPCSLFTHVLCSPYQKAALPKAVTGWATKAPVCNNSMHLLMSSPSWVPLLKFIMLSTFVLQSPHMLLGCTSIVQRSLPPGERL